MTSRRNFLKGFAATLAAAAVLPVEPRAAATELDRLTGILHSGGTIRGQHFVFYQGETIILQDLHNITIEYCTFEWRDVPPEFFVRFGKLPDSQLIECHFMNNTGKQAKAAFRFEEGDVPDLAVAQRNDVVRLVRLPT